MFHEVAHGPGIKNTIAGKGTVHDAPLEQHSALEVGKADMLGLYMLEMLRDKGVVTKGSAMNDHVTFMAGIFRSVRSVASSAHGRANVMRLNFFVERGAFVRNADGTYSVVEAIMRDHRRARRRDPTHAGRRRGGRGSDHDGEEGHCERGAAAGS